MGQKSNHEHLHRSGVDELSILNHELGNVLNGLSGMAGLLRDSGLTVEQARWLEAIEQSGQQMCRIMESTLFYRDGPQSGTGAKCDRLDGIELLEDVVVSHTPAAMEKGLGLTLVVSADLPATWHSDRGLLRQLLDNLVGNAVKFTSSGGVTVRATVARDEILHLAVCDSGPGVSQPERLFEPWVRGAEGREGIAGCGLGLYVCKCIVEKMGGTLTVSSKHSDGARFDVKIPAGLKAVRCDSVRIKCLQGLYCILDLEQPMLGSVRGFLDRLGIPWTHKGLTGHGNDGADLEIQITPAESGQGTTGLRISPRVAGAAPSEVLLAPPILESCLERALFQLLLQRSFDEVSRNDTPG